MNEKTYLGQDVLYTLPTNKEECAAKVVRIVDKTRQIVNLVLFTDAAFHNEIARNVAFDESGAAPNTWRRNEQQEQVRSVGVGSSR